MNFTPVILLHPDTRVPGLNLKSGTKVTEAWVGNGPIVLVAGMSVDGKAFRTRLDLQKEMFVDPVPDKQDLTDAPSVVASVKLSTKEHPQ